MKIFCRNLCRLRASACGIGIPLLLLVGLTAWAAPLPPGQTLYDATFGGGTFVAVGTNGTIFSSVNGGPWDLRASPTTNRLTAVGYGAGTFVAAGDNGTLITSSNGVNWTLRNIDVVLANPRIAYGNGRFIVGGNRGNGFWTMLVSTNAVNWVAVNVEAAAPPLASEMTFGGLSFGAGQFLATGGLVHGARLFLTSTDGFTWKEHGTFGPTGVAKRLIHGNGQFAMIEHFYYEDDDDDGGFYDRLLLSPDGVSWQWVNGLGEYSAVAAGDCTFVLAGSSYGNNHVSYSHGGSEWSVLSFPPETRFNALAHGNGTFVGVGTDIVQLNIPPAPAQFPISPTSYNVVQGNYISFYAGAPCFPPPLRYQWRHNGADVPSATNYYLVFPNVMTNDSGQYTVVAISSAGLMATSIVATLTVVPPQPIEPQLPIIYWPSYHITNVSVIGEDAGIYVSATGWPPPSYQWRRDGIDIPGATNSNLSFYNITASDTGNYSAVVRNSAGSVTSGVVTVAITDARPNLVSSSTAISAREGARVDFLTPGYYAPGVPRADYYVLKNGIDIDLPLSAFGSLTLREVSLPDAGEYVFVASNHLGMSTGLVATLNVSPGGLLDHWTQRNPLPQNETLLDVVYGNGKFVAVGQRGTVVSSTNGTNWSVHRLRAEVLLSGMAFGNGLFVAVGEGNVLTSFDGVSWTTRLTRVQLSYFFSLQSVVFANGRFVVAGGDTILTSTDGVTWSDASLTATVRRELRDVTFGNGTFVAVGNGQGEPTVWSSANGIDWSPVNGGPMVELESVTFANGQFVAVGNNGVIFTSPNGTTWTSRDSDVGSRLLGVAFGNGRYVVTGTRGRLLSSANGVSWTKETSGTPDRLESVTFGGGLFVALGENGTILSSVNGTAWIKRSQGATRDLDGMTVGNGVIAIAGKGGTILTSSNGIDYIQQITGVTNDLHGVGWANGLFVAVGEPEIILTSSDSVQWTVRHRGTNSSLKSAGWGGNAWVVVGTEGAIFTSADGVNWTRPQSPTCNDLNQVAFGNGLFVVVGDNFPPNGTLLTSPDGSNWTRRNQYIGKNLRSVAHANNLFLATANDGVVLVSTNGFDWESRFTSLYRNYVANLRAATYAAGVWVITGNQGLVLSSTNTYDWEPHSTPTLENLHGIVYHNHRFVTIGNRGTVLQSDYFARPAHLTGRQMFNGFMVSLDGQLGVNYRLESTDQLPATNWTTLGSFTLTQSTTNFLDLRSPVSQRFYRAVSP